MAGFGMRDSVRFSTSPTLGVTLETVVVLLLKKTLNVKVRDIVCLQDFPGQGIFDVTFASSEMAWNVYERAREKKKEEILKDFTVTPLFMREEKMITVHLYNPFADPALVRAFLSAYCEELQGGDKVYNKYGIWSGKYKFIGRFKSDSDCVGGVKRPPAVFSIGGERGFLFYPGQPMYCRNCLSYGHTKAQCEKGQRCRFCGSADHLAAQCKEQRVCDLCRKTGHLARNCDLYKTAKRAQMFSDVVRNSRTGGRSRVQVDSDEEQGGDVPKRSAADAGSAGSPPSASPGASGGEAESDEVRGAGADPGVQDPTGGPSSEVNDAEPVPGDPSQQENVEMEVETAEDPVDEEVPHVKDDAGGLESHGPPTPDTIMGDISSSEEGDEEEGDEEDEEDGEEEEEEEEDSERSLTCGQKVALSPDEEESARKKIRREDSSGGEEALTISLSGGADNVQEPADSPAPVRRQSGRLAKKDVPQKI